VRRGRSGEFRGHVRRRRCWHCRRPWGRQVARDWRGDIRRSNSREVRRREGWASSRFVGRQVGRCWSGVCRWNWKTAERKFKVAFVVVSQAFHIHPIRPNVVNLVRQNRAIEIAALIGQNFCGRTTRAVAVHGHPSVNLRSSGTSRQEHENRLERQNDEISVAAGITRKGAPILVASHDGGVTGQVLKRALIVGWQWRGQMSGGFSGHIRGLGRRHKRRQWRRHMRWRGGWFERRVSRRPCVRLTSGVQGGYRSWHMRGLRSRLSCRQWCGLRGRQRRRQERRFGRWHGRRQWRGYVRGDWSWFWSGFTGRY